MVATFETRRTTDLGKCNHYTVRPDISDIRCFVFVQSNFGPSPSVLCIILANGAASIHRLRKIEQLRQSVSGMLEHGGYDKMI